MASFTDIHHVERKYRKFAWVLVGVLFGALFVYLLVNIFFILQAQVPKIQVSAESGWGQLPDVLLCSTEEYHADFEYGAVYGWAHSTLSYVDNMTAKLRPYPDDAGISIRVDDGCIRYSTSLLAPTFFDTSLITVREVDWQNGFEVRAAFRQYSSRPMWPALEVWLVDVSGAWSWMGYVEPYLANASVGSVQVAQYEKSIVKQGFLMQTRQGHYKAVSQQVISNEQPQLAVRSVNVPAPGESPNESATLKSGQHKQALKQVHLAFSTGSPEIIVVARITNIEQILHSVGEFGGYVSVFGLIFTAFFVNKYPFHPTAQKMNLLTLRCFQSEEDDQEKILSGGDSDSDDWQGD